MFYSDFKDYDEYYYKHIIQYKLTQYFSHFLKFFVKIFTNTLFFTVVIT